jgi:hypothetical protein
MSAGGRAGAALTGAADRSCWLKHTMTTLVLSQAPRLSALAISSMDTRWISPCSYRRCRVKLTTSWILIASHSPYAIQIII